MRRPLSRVIGNSLAALHGPNANGSSAEQRLDKRRLQIEAMKNPVVRGIALTIHDLTEDSPVKAEKWRRRMGGKPADFVGTGDFAAVYTTPDMPGYVQKYYRRFTDNPAMHKRVLDYKMGFSSRLFGDTALATQIDLKIDPLTELEMPVGLQKYCSYNQQDAAFPDLDTSEEYSAYYESLEDRHPGSTSAILAFCVLAQTSWINEGIMPDVLRPENAVIGSVDKRAAELYLIGTVPHFTVEAQYITAHGQILDKINMATRTL